MPTTNVNLTTTWTKVAESSDSELLIQAHIDVKTSRYALFEIAAVATDTAPTVLGHQVYYTEQAVTRDTIGSGYLYARAIDPEAITLVVTK